MSLVFAVDSIARASKHRHNFLFLDIVLAGVAKMKRRLFIIAVAVSLVWWFATAGGWVLTRWHAFSIPSTAPGEPVQWIDVDPLDKKFEITFSRGSVLIRWRELTEKGELKLLNSTYFDAGPSAFRFQRAPTGNAPRGYPWARHGVLKFPIWVLVLAGTVLPAWWYVTYLRDRRVAHRRAAGLCPACGYDLRASSDRCPECGAVLDARPAAAETTPAAGRTSGRA